jgi:hypothetical protein
VRRKIRQAENKRSTAFFAGPSRETPLPTGDEERCSFRVLKNSAYCTAQFVAFETVSNEIEAQTQARQDFRDDTGVLRQVFLTVRGG